MNRATPQMTWLCPTRLFDGQHLLEGHAAGIADGVCVAVVPVGAIPAGDAQVAVDGILSPGFVDLQVNGGGGHLVNADPSADCMEAIAATHARFGTVAILPTVITDRSEVLANAVDAAIAAQGRRGIAGLHIEGPHISVPRRGTHRAEYVRALDYDTIDHVRRLRAAGVRVMITVAPEAADTQQIAALAATGAVVSIGHTDVDADAATASFAAGARAVTHLFNAMSPMENRAPGVTGAAINSDACAGIICDGVHVDDRMVALAFRARPEPDRMFLVSDAMPTVGGPDHFSLYGQDIRRDGKRLVNAEGGLAGAHTTMADGVARLVNVVGIDAETALRAAIHVPSSLMGLGLDQMEGRVVDDLIVLNDRMEFTGPATNVMADQ